MNGSIFDWATLALNTIVMLIMIGTLIFTVRQLREMRRSAVGQNTLAMIQLLQNPEVRRARTTVLASLRTKPMDDWSEEDRREASLVCATYDVLSVLLYQCDIAPDDPFVENWGPSIRNCFEVLKPFIEMMQLPENGGASYWNDFERLYWRVKKKQSVQ